jgi:hypothetical protein
MKIGKKIGMVIFSFGTLKENSVSRVTIQKQAGWSYGDIID